MEVKIFHNDCCRVCQLLLWRSVRYSHLSEVLSCGHYRWSSCLYAGRWLMPLSQVSSTKGLTPNTASPDSLYWPPQFPCAPRPFARRWRPDAPATPIFGRCRYLEQRNKPLLAANLVFIAIRKAASQLIFMFGLAHPVYSDQQTIMELTDNVTCGLAALSSVLCIIACVIGYIQ